MSRLITSSNLYAYHTELAEHIKLLQRGITYSLNNIVNYDGKTLKCTTAGTTATTKPNISALDVGDTYTDGTCVWTIVDLDKRGIDYWASSTTYALNDQVVYNDKIYKCSNAHTSTSTFDDTKWTEISASSGGGLDYWATSTSYSVDDIVVYNNQIWRCTTAHTSSSTFDSTKFTEISASGAGGISVWASNTQYAVNDVVIDSNLIWQCATAHTSTLTFDESKWICISGGEISNGMEIVTLWEGSYSFSNATQGATPTSSTPMIELSDSINNYEYIYIATELGDGTDSHAVTVPVSLADDIRIGMSANPSFYSTGVLSKYDNTHFYMKNNDTANWQPANVVKICGIRKAKPIVSSGMKYETLWEGEAGSLSGEGSGTITLSESLRRYQKFGVQYKCLVDNMYRYYYREFDTTYFLDWISNTISGDHGFSSTWGYANYNDYVNILHDSTDTQIKINFRYSIITKIIGISEGVQIPTGVQAARVTLWEGSYNTANNSLTSYSNTIALVDSIENYDLLEITINLLSSQNENNFNTIIFNVSDIKYNEASIRLAAGYGSNFGSFLCSCSDSTHFAICYNNSMNGYANAVLTKIVGIKYIQPDSYSTEEKLIGTWIDGKPLYRKVFENPTNGMNTGLTNFNARRIYGEFIDANVGNYIPIPWNSGSFFVGAYINSLGVLTIQSSISSPNVVWIAIEYTKN